MALAVEDRLHALARAPAEGPPGEPRRGDRAGAIEEDHALRREAHARGDEELLALEGIVGLREPARDPELPDVLEVVAQAAADHVEVVERPEVEEVDVVAAPHP